MARDNQDPKGRWVNVRQLAETGQGWLFVSKDQTGQDDGEFVRKVLKNKQRFRRFQREIETTLRLVESGCSVVPIIDVFDPGVGDKRPYYVTPFYPRGNLRQLAASGYFQGNLPRAAAFLRHLYVALVDIHKITAHRDLKPENILIDDQCRPVICDFGLCLPLAKGGLWSRLTSRLEQVGSRHYIAPEALAGYPFVGDPLGLDYYAYGKIAYELVIGEVLPGILPCPDLTQRCGDSPTWVRLWQMIKRLVSHDPLERSSEWESLPWGFVLLHQAINGHLFKKNDGRLFYHSATVISRLYERQTGEIPPHAEVGYSPKSPLGVADKRVSDELLRADQETWDRRFAPSKKRRR